MGVTPSRGRGGLIFSLDATFAIALASMAILLVMSSYTAYMATSHEYTIDFRMERILHDVQYVLSRVSGQCIPTGEDFPYPTWEDEYGPPIVPGCAVFNMWEHRHMPYLLSSAKLDRLYDIVQNRLEDALSVGLEESRYQIKIAVYALEAWARWGPAAVAMRTRSGEAEGKSSGWDWSAVPEKEKSVSLPVLFFDLDDPTDSYNYSKMTPAVMVVTLRMVEVNAG